MQLKFFFAIWSMLVLIQTKAELKVVCYYASWESYKNINPENFDAGLCTHINYAFIGLWENGNVRVVDDNLDIKNGLYRRVTDMKKRNPQLKVLLSVGGGAEGMADLFSGMAGDPAKRGAFVGSVTYFIQTYNFDGLDMDWEVPKASDKENYINLLREVREAFKQHGWLLTAAVPANPDVGYQIDQMTVLLDWLNIMTYDMYGPWSSYTGQNSALYASSQETDWERGHLNMAACSNNWVMAGVPKDKLVLGIAFYGRSFTLIDPNQHGLHAPINRNSDSQQAINYYDICQSYNHYTRMWDDEQKNPFRYFGNQWIGYDDEDSVQAKGAFIRANGFSGAIIWSIDKDDVFGKCGVKQNLLRHVNSGLGR